MKKSDQKRAPSEKTKSVIEIIKKCRVESKTTEILKTNQFSSQKYST